jgi:hypothetical protein
MSVWFVVWFFNQINQDLTENTFSVLMLPPAFEVLKELRALKSKGRARERLREEGRRVSVCLPACLRACVNMCICVCVPAYECVYLNVCVLRWVF